MEVWIIPLLGLMMPGAVLAFARASKVETEKRMADPEAPKSTLAAVGPDSRD